MQVRETGPLLIAAFLGTILLPAASAQSQSSQTIGGSESQTAIAQDAEPSGGPASSSSFRAYGLVGGHLAGPPASSGQYQDFPGLAWMGGLLGPGLPLVAGTTPVLGPATGGTPITVLGANFGPPGATPIEVQIGGAPAHDAQVVSSTTITATTPPGTTGVYGTPAGPTAVVVTTPAGTGTKARAFVYTPALTFESQAVVGDTLAITLYAEPPYWHVLAGSSAISTTPIPIPPLAGGLELALVTLFVPTGLDFSTQADHTFSFPVPWKPSLIGNNVALQAVVFSTLDPLAGSLTNSLTVVFQP